MFMNEFDSMNYSMARGEHPIHECSHGTSPTIHFFQAFYLSNFYICGRVCFFPSLMNDSK